MKTGRVYCAVGIIASLEVVFLICAPAARADVLWVEVANGDLSGDRFNPTPFTLSPGTSELFGVLGGDDGQGSFDRDYYSVTVPSGYVLSQIVLELYLSTDATSFLGIQPGPIFPNDPATVHPADLFGWTHFGPSLQDTDLLALMGTHGQGFTPPLAAGTYTFWAQQIDDYTEYTLDFVVDVPEPGSVVCLAAGLMLLIRTRGRRGGRTACSPFAG